MPHLLLLEDDALLGETLQEELEEAGYRVTWVRDADAAADAAYETPFDCYLFDVNVPGMSGFELLESLRGSQDETPTLFLTSRSAMKDLEEGFRVGADDYLVKPFRMPELLIRLKARVRSATVLSIAPECDLDPDTRTLRVHGAPQTLPRREFEILHYFLRHRKRIVSKDEIIDMLYEGEPISDATFRVYVRQINKHLQGCAKLANVRGVGYRFEPL